MCPRLKSALILPKKAEKQDPKELFPSYTTASQDTVFWFALLPMRNMLWPYLSSFLCNRSFFFGCFSTLAGGLPVLCDLWEFFLMILPGDFSWLWVISTHSRTDQNSLKTPGTPSADPPSCCLLLCPRSVNHLGLPAPSAWVPCTVPCALRLGYFL